MFKEIVSKRSKLYAGFAGIAALALFSACADEPAQEEEPVDPGVEQQDPTQQDPMQEDPATDPMQEDPAEDPMQDAPAEDTGTEGGDVEGAGDDSATSTLGFLGASVSWGL